ncbi:hypothetical protein GGH12_003100 [Coemansia sp. RSA 1822]|nr:hypothetical protein IW147_000508 [Coemansia sp. RSA 720]KAJ2545799.1 hypothetical protein GGF49_000002 [Coemansia sp. RSA 1853]KAJ2562574.1 hypothetical protein GGH12_003100 [Coemansia sp. RSA 1822]
MDGQNRGDANAGTSATFTPLSPLFSQLPALSPTLLTRRTSIANTDKPLPNLQTHLVPAQSTREHTSAHERQDSKVDQVALMLARAEVANDLLYSDPKRVVIEDGSLQADKDILRSLADVQSPMRTEVDVQLPMQAEADVEPDTGPNAGTNTGPEAGPEAGTNAGADSGTASPASSDSYRVYPEGDERALPEFILNCTTMTELDAQTSEWAAALDELSDGAFWRAVVDDVDGLQARAPLHLAAKIRAGIPARVRGVVWQTLTRARSTYLQTVYTQLVLEHSPHERVIRRDLTRTFPKVPVFKREGGEAQQRLFRILKAYSLYDAEVGYCQGLGFIIGPLIMSMGECEAFCVLVRLMETYDLRGMFTEDMAGLHLRLFQFQALATEIAPELMAHLERHGVVPAMYVPSWFLSLFAYTMPLSFVLRAMDVIMAERAPEAIIRIGVALLQRNADTLLAQDDFESTMGVLTSGLYNDDLPRDRPGFVLQEAARLGAVVTSARLDELEAQYCRDQGVVLKGRSSTASARPVPPSSHAAVIKFLGWPWSKDWSNRARQSSPVPRKSESSEEVRSGQTSPRVLELTHAQRERSRQLREQILKSLQQQDGVPLTILGANSNELKQHSEPGASEDVAEPATPSAPLNDSSWRDHVLEPLQQQLHDARVTSDTHRDALVALQADSEALRAELVVVKTGRAELAAENEQLRMHVRRLEAERVRSQQASNEQILHVQRVEESVVRTRMELAEADEERALLERQLSNLRKYIADAAPMPREDGVVPRARVMSIDASSSPTSPVLSPSTKANRFSMSSFASNWSALRDAITSPRPMPATDDVPTPTSPRRSSVTVRSAASSVSDERASSNTAIPLSMLHRSKTMSAVPTIPKGLSE